MEPAAEVTLPVEGQFATLGEAMDTGLAETESVSPGAPSPGPASPSSPGPRRLLAGLGVIALLASALFGGNVLGVRERFLGSETPEARAPAASRAPVGLGAPAPLTSPQETVLRSQPWWQSVGGLEGSGSTATSAVSIDGGAIQWRVRAACQSGRLVVRAPGQARPVVDASCPGNEIGYGIRQGNVSLDVSADGPWQLQVDQQVDVPLREPPLPSMSAPGATAVAGGTLYRVDQVGTGGVMIYRLADGTYALRLDDFFVTANSDLELQLSTLEAPRTTEEIRSTRSATVASLDVTTGSLNFPVPPGVDPTKYRSLVIWCERTSNAYAAASLKPA